MIARLKDSGFVPQNLPGIEVAKKVNNFDEFIEILKKEYLLRGRKRYEIGNEIVYIEKAFSAKPFIFSLTWPKLYSEFPVIQATEVVKRGIVPFVYGG